MTFKSKCHSGGMSKLLLIFITIIFFVCIFTSWACAQTYTGFELLVRPRVLRAPFLNSVLNAGKRELSKTTNQRTPKLKNSKSALKATQSITDVKNDIDVTKKDISLVAVTIINDKFKARAVLDVLSDPSVIWACDTEVDKIDIKTQGPVGNGEVTCVSIYGGPSIDFGLGEGPGSALWIENIGDAQGLLKEVFQDWFADERYKKVWHNYGFDRHVMYNHRIDCKGFAGDTMHMARLWDTSRDRAFAFAFFADPNMQSFYRRFVRDFMRYQDEIQCAGSDVVAAVRADALQHNPDSKGEYYALHVRRGDFQFKDVKIEASQIVKNLNSLDEILIPRGALVYLSTDDPNGVCEGCRVLGVPCEEYAEGKKPVGCPVDSSWKAFADAGWTIRRLDDYIDKGVLKNVNPNFHGMIESIVCSRAKVFAGTWFSTFTGYIHRLRGYHGLGEDTYYHSTGYVKHLRMEKSVGHGFSREWRAGWTDDGGELI
eukprot:gene2582-5051_t